jgi:hypothetical protein
MYSGRLDMEIPLTKLEDIDFDFPISLRYNSSGFMPAKSDGLVGLDWSLSCGGTIIREVKGIPDDIPVNKSGLFFYTEYGFLYFLKNKNKLNHTDVVNNPKSYIHSTYVQESNYPRMINKTLNDNSITSLYDFVEASSDVYHFNFGKHSGKFTIKFDGSVNVISSDGKEYDVDLSEYNYALFNGSNSAPSKITITTDDGYKYIFGGTFNAMEYSIQWRYNPPVMNSLEPWNSFEILMDPHGGYNITISSFNLTRIIAPSGRTLIINYKELPDHYYIRSDMLNTLMSKDTKTYSDIFSSTLTASFSGWESECRDFPNSTPRRSEVGEISHTLTKLALIESIKTDNQIIDFTYKKDNKTPLDKITLEPLLPIEKVAGAKLTDITHYSTNYINNVEPKTLISERISLNYDLWKRPTTKENGFERSFLRTVNINNRGKYTFDYNRPVTAPLPYTRSVDYWNYWLSSEVGTNSDFLVSGIDIYTGDIIFYKSPRDGDENYGSANYGMLTSITYPTGGTSHFVYEHHDYSREIQRNQSTNFLPKLVDLNKNCNAGGVRIKEIRENDGTGNLKGKRCFYYKKNIDKDISSGILNFKPVTISVVSFEVSPSLEEIQWTDGKPGSVREGNGENLYRNFSNMGFNTASYENDHVVYSSVIEEVKNDPKMHKEDCQRYGGGHGWEEKTFITPTEDTEEVSVTIKTRLSDGDTASVRFYENSDKLLKELKYTATDIGREYFYRLGELGLRTGSKYRVILETWKSSVISFILSYPEIGQKIEKYRALNEFYSYEDHPDEMELGKVYDDVPADPLTIYRAFDINRNLDPIDRSNLRGQLKNQIYYNSKKQLIKKTAYSYGLVYQQTPTANTENYHLSVYFKKLIPAMGYYVTLDKETGIPRFHYIPTYLPVFQMVPIRKSYNKLLSKKTIEYLYDDYDPDGYSVYDDSIINVYNPHPTDSLVLEEKYSYKKPYYYLSGESQKGSDGRLYSTSYKYNSEETSEKYNIFIQKHIFNLITEVEKKVDNQAISFLRNNYSLRPRIIIDSLETGRDRNLLQTQYAVKKYGLWGPTEVVARRNKEIFYKWNRSGYLTGKVENPRIFQGIHILNESSLDDIRISNPNGFITTYEHKPGIGLYSKTDVRGIPLYYDYNEKNNWLERIYSVINGTKYIYNYYKVKFAQE